MLADLARALRVTTDELFGLAPTRDATPVMKSHKRVPSGHSPNGSEKLTGSPPAKP